MNRLQAWIHNVRANPLNEDQLLLANDVASLLDENEKLRKALDAIDHELGRPEGLRIPAPVVNASFIAREALGLPIPSNHLQSHSNPVPSAPCSDT
jgi:prophage antirepressor-like protein